MKVKLKNKIKRKKNIKIMSWIPFFVIFLNQPQKTVAISDGQVKFSDGAQYFG
jgi:hypothetical protein